MTDERREFARAHEPVGAGAWALRRTGARGFRLSLPDERHIEAREGAGFLELWDAGRPSGLRLASDGERGHFVQDPGSGDEIARTSRTGAASSDLVSADGRLFRVRLIGPRAPVVELAGRYGGGLLEARPEAQGGWNVLRTAAGSVFEPALDVLVLFAAEVFSFDEVDERS